MSTEIKDQSESYGPHFLDDLGNGWVNLLAVRPGHEVTATMSRADLLAAVATECDAIVIPHADLPKVCVDTSGRPGVPGVTPEIRTESAEKARYLAGCWLALAEYLDAHPPVDEAQVEALARLLWEYAQNPSGPGDTFDETNDAERNRHRNRAARLVARGVRVDLP